MWLSKRNLLKMDPIKLMEFWYPFFLFYKLSNPSTKFLQFVIIFSDAPSRVILQDETNIRPLRMIWDIFEKSFLIFFFIFQNIYLEQILLLYTQFFIHIHLSYSLFYSSICHNYFRVNLKIFESHSNCSIRYATWRWIQAHGTPHDGGFGIDINMQLPTPASFPAPIFTNSPSK